MKKSLPIGIFDSGIGGLTVYRKIRNLLPKENLLYFGDTGRAPYGSRDKKQLYEYVDEIMTFMSLCNIKVGVVACNTLTVLGTDLLSEHYSFDLVGNSTGVISALNATKNKRIGIIATETTIKSGNHQKQLESIDSHVKVVAQACPKFASLIESGNTTGPELQKIAEIYLAPLKHHSVDTLVLACTHYPYIQPLLQKIMGERVVIIDPAEETAQNTKDYLASICMLNENSTAGLSQFYFSSDPAKVQKTAANLFDTSNCQFKYFDLNKLSSIIPVIKQKQ